MLGWHSVAFVAPYPQGERLAGLVLTSLVIVALAVLALKDPGVVPISSEPVGELSTFCEKVRFFSALVVALCYFELQTWLRSLLRVFELSRAHKEWCQRFHREVM